MQPFDVNAVGSNIVREIAEVPEQWPVPEPHAQFVHTLFLYPTALNMAKYSGKSSARNLSMATKPGNEAGPTRDEGRGPYGGHRLTSKVRFFFARGGNGGPEPMAQACAFRFWRPPEPSRFRCAHACLPTATHMAWPAET